MVTLAIPGRTGSRGPSAPGGLFWMNQAVFWASPFQNFRKNFGKFWILKSPKLQYHRNFYITTLVKITSPVFFTAMLPTANKFRYHRNFYITTLVKITPPGVGWWLWLFPVGLEAEAHLLQGAYSGWTRLFFGPAHFRISEKTLGNSEFWNHRNFTSILQHW